MLQHKKIKQYLEKLTTIVKKNRVKVDWLGYIASNGAIKPHY